MVAVKLPALIHLNSVTSVAGSPLASPMNMIKENMNENNTAPQPMMAVNPSVDLFVFSAINKNPKKGKKGMMAAINCELTILSD